MHSLWLRSSYRPFDPTDQWQIVTVHRAGSNSRVVLEGYRWSLGWGQQRMIGVWVSERTLKGLGT